jgi:hypothetical protein
MAKNTIVVKDADGHRDEKVAAGTITPGMLVERTSADKVQAHSTAGGPANKLFAIEDENQGNGITDNYSATNTVKLWHPLPGDQVYALLDDASSVTAIVIGDYVESAGDGRFRKFVAGNSAVVNEQSNSIVGVALEAQSTAGGRFIMEII